MSSRERTHVNPVVTALSFRPPTSGLLQRKCACSGSGASGQPSKCETCEHKKLQRKAAGHQPESSTVPPVVHDVLRSAGQPLDTATRVFMEPRFGHDFSQVRVHAGGHAGESALAVNALAYTVGRDVVFASGQYEPRTTAGRQLIAHELTHVVQQSMAGTTPSGELSLGAPHDQAEQEAERASLTLGHGISAGVSFAGRPRLQRQTPAGTPAEAAAEPTARAVENCPFPSDFEDANQAGMNMMCVGDEAFRKAPSCNLTDQHFALINAARAVAKKRVDKANSRMAWLGGPEYAQRIAGKVFTGTPPDAKTIKETLGKMVQILGGTSLSFNGATCADPLCESKGEHAVAYESGPTEPVTLCPRSFLPQYLPELPRTILHEAVHLSGIDIDPDVKEVYCATYGCDQPCRDATVADAWALFIDCIGGPLIKPKTEKPAFTPRTSFDEKTVRTVEGEFGS